MQTIQLIQFENGKPLILNAKYQQLTKRINELNAKRKYKEILQLTKQMQQCSQKYLIATNALLHLKSWQKLIQYCDRGLKLSVQSQFLHLKGKALGKLGYNHKKIQLIQQAIKIKDFIPTYHRNLGAAYYNDKEYEKSIASHIKAVQIEPDNSINYHNIGMAYYRMKSYQNALDNFQKAIDKKQNQAISFSWKGDCYKHLKKYEQALESYTKAYNLSKDPVYLREKQKMEAVVNEINTMMGKDEKQDITKK